MSRRWQRYFQQLRPVQWWRSAWLLLRGTRMSPQATLIGPPGQMHLSAGTRIGPGTRIDLGATGQVRTGRRTWLAEDVVIETEGRVAIGEGTTVQRRCTLNGHTRIGAHCILAPDVFISSGTHPFREVPHLPIRLQEQRLGQDPEAARRTDRPVWVQDDCWLGTHAVVCPGVILGRGTVVGANAVVTRSFPPYSVIGGIPARLIGQRLVWQPPARIDFTDPAHQVYLLEGTLAGDALDRPRGATVNDDGTVALALACPPDKPRRIAVTFMAPVAQTWSVGTLQLVLQPGSHTTTVEVTTETLMPGVWMVRLRGPATLPPEASAVIQSLSLLEPEPEPHTEADDPIH